MKQLSIAEIVFDFLAKKNLTHLFYLAGGGSMYLNNALNNQKKIIGVPCHHEQACGIAAESYAKISSCGFGAALVTTGPGATNILTPVAGAWIESSPLFIISGQVKTEDLILSRKIRQSGTQEIDIVKMVKSITKYSTTITDPSKIYETMNTAFEEMIEGRPGPVWIDIPLDIQKKKIKEEIFDKKFTHSLNKNKFNSSKVINFLNKSNRPVILLGNGCKLSKSEALIFNFLKIFNIPFLTTWPALDLVEYRHKLNMGRPGVVAPRSANFVLQNCDLLICVGARLDNNITAYNPNNLSRAAKKIIIDIDMNELREKKSFSNLSLCISAYDFFSEINTKTLEKNKNYNEWISICQNWKQKYDITFENNSSIANKYSDKFTHKELIDSLSILLPQNRSIVTGSSGLAIEFFYAHYKNKKKQKVFHTSGLGSMGYGLPALLGVALISQKRIYLIESDGSFQLNIQELATLKSLKLSPCIFIMNNGGYASIRASQRTHFSGLYNGCDKTTGLFFPDLKKIASAYCIEYKKVSDFLGLKKIINHYEKKPKFTIIEIMLNEQEVLEPKCSAIFKDDIMYSMPLEDMSPLMNLDDLRDEMLIPLTKISYKARNE